MICPNPKCKSVIPDDSKYCPDCGTKVIKTNTCLNCGAENIPKGSNFCPDCGKPVMSIEEQSPKPSLPTLKKAEDVMAECRKKNITLLPSRVPSPVYCNDYHLVFYYDVMYYVADDFSSCVYHGVILSLNGQTAKMRVNNGKPTFMDVFHPNGEQAALMHYYDNTPSRGFDGFSFYNTYGIEIPQFMFMSKFYPRYQKEIESFRLIRSHNLF